jgi:diguanylate cyclase (GGDEF)-like protein
MSDMATRASAAIDALPDTCLLLVDRSFRIVHASGAAEAVLGWSPAHLTGRFGYEFIHADDLAFALAERERIARIAGASPARTTPSIGLVEMRSVQPDGSYVFIEYRSQELHQHPDVGALALWCRRVPEPTAIDVAMQQIASGAPIADVLSVLASYLDSDPSVLAAHVVVFRRDGHLVVGAHGVVSAAGTGAVLKVAELVLDGLPPRREGTHAFPVREPGHERPSGAIVIETYDDVTLGGRQVATTAARVAGTAIAVERAMEQLRHTAGVDSLTGLANRSRLETWLDGLDADRAACGIVVVDLDRFKSVNDQHGHAAGDLLLIEIATRLRREVREVDLVARLGGDEFVVLCAGSTSQDELEQVAQRVREACVQPVTIAAPGSTAPTIATVGASVGIAVRSHHEDTRTTLRRADLACLAQKVAHRQDR